MRDHDSPAAACRVTFLLAVLVASVSAAASGDSLPPLPRFEDYPAIEKFDGMAKPPVLSLPVDRLYRTRLRRGVTNGEGLLGVSQAKSPPRPNFAGAYFAITWGCGSDACAALAVVDARTGRVFGPPPDGNASASNFVATPRTSGCPGIELRPNSRMIIVDQPVHADSAQAVCRRNYYEWRDQRYRLIGKFEAAARPD